MSEMVEVNVDKFKVGTRVIVAPPDGEVSSDCDWRGRAGVVVKAGNASCEVLMDKPKSQWPNPVWLCCHNLRVVGARKVRSQGEQQP